jgi:hypothetical protein
MQGRFCKKVLRIPPITVNGTAEHGLGKDSRRGKIFCRASKLWCRILQKEQEELLKCCYDWKIGNLKWQS